MSEKIRVLIVDDSLDMRRILTTVFCYFAPDMEVIALADDGREGIRLTKEHHPDIVLMDVNLPGVDGITATRTLSQETPSSRVILMSSEVGPEELRRSRSAGAQHVFAKPIDSDELITSIRTIHRPVAVAV